ncbi:MAG TPA: PD-(D/E)XK motif protein [Tepidisphaeraceae bacterium]|jgi:hypothetical protein|nr:PD-(D/E)XK motif protein [Tepidisphaeraceae bacterium]
MQIEELWKSLEADAASGHSGTGGWLLRLARPAADHPLFVGLELSSGRRAILLQLPTDYMPSRRLWPRSKGLEPLAVALDGNAHFGVALKDSRFTDVFTALAEDLCRRVTETADPASQARAFLGQLARWQKFLSASVEGLNDETQRGLWGELRFLRDHLLSWTGAAAVKAWKGGERLHQDFQFEGVAIEVKTTLAKMPQVIRITNERQLDHTTWSALFLNVIALDVRDAGGETLPAMVASLRDRLTADAIAREQFEDELLLAGYLDAHTPRYIDRGYTVRSVTFFHVGPGFPSLIEADMPPGVGDANYALSISACERFKVKATELESALAGQTPPRAKRRGRA